MEWRLLERKAVDNSEIMVTSLQLNLIITVEEPALSFSLDLFQLPCLENRRDVSKAAVAQRVDNNPET